MFVFTNAKPRLNSKSTNSAKETITDSDSL